MKRFISVIMLFVFLGGFLPIGYAAEQAPTSSTPDQIGGCNILPANNIWNTPVINAPVHTRSNDYINRIGSSRGLHADFGSGVWPPGSGNLIGIPYTSVNGDSIPWRNIIYQAYGDESDPGPFPIPLSSPIEAGGDRHVLTVDVDNCMLYELFRAFTDAPNWLADSGAAYDLNSNALRPAGWTSADGAGLPILPGLVRYDEVQAAIAGDGVVHHAFRFTVPNVHRSYVWPARHLVNNITDPTYPSMGQRFRLHMSEAEISTYSPEAQVILRTLTIYGMIIADIGSAAYISGAPDERWDNDVLHEIDDVTMGRFVAVDVNGFMVNADSGEAIAPANRPAATLFTPVHTARTTDSTPTFTWSPIYGADMYRVWVYSEDKTTYNIKARTIAAETSLTWKAINALPPGKYLWRVRARDAASGEWGLWSKRNTIFIEGAALTEPTQAPLATVTPTPTVTPTLEPSPTPDTTTMTWLEAEDAYTEQLLTATGTWAIIDHLSASNSQYVASSGVPADVLEVPFSGDTLGIVYAQLPNGGTWHIEIDGVVMPPLVTLGAEQFGLTLWFTGLGAGNHVLRVSSADGLVAIDAFWLTAPILEPTVEPTGEATLGPTLEPTATEEATSEPTLEPTVEPTSEPSAEPSPTVEPSPTPTATLEPTLEPSPTSEASATDDTILE